MNSDRQAIADQVRANGCGLIVEIAKRLRQGDRLALATRVHGGDWAVHDERLGK